MRALRTLLLAVLTVCLLGATAYGASVAVRHFDTGTTTASNGPDPTSSPDPAPSGSPAPVAAPSPEPITRPSPVLRPGDRGRQVRELQHRLFQLAWFPELTTGSYDADTRAAVRGFQDKRGLKATGVVDPRTWKQLRAMTDLPSDDQLRNVLRPGPAILAAGATGEQVRAVQHRLMQIQWLGGDVTGTYDPATVAAIRGFQDKRAIPVTGEVDQRTLDRLTTMTRTPTYDEMHNIRPEPGGLDPRCTTGRALCVDKSGNNLRWVVDGRILKTLDVRFGSQELPTREGAFSVHSKSRDHVSSLYDTPMPFALFFSGGQAVHYSPDFAATGYNGASHGCVNVRDHAAMSWLFDQVRIGDKVIVYRS
ncbi:peptidoglycan-binding protein [Nocardioides sp.]|uniref:L,D-transpeptidase family protein n=1 Tax=Nocardioides sp. TaxID=35761 RepID=UPI002735DAFE|nr:peptidoglycan-binding protein [Nocardioides sp.]MDP3890448.1 peptidoglycan-binding protein [Nocardioides sp.]